MVNVSTHEVAHVVILECRTDVCSQPPVVPSSRPSNRVDIFEDRITGMKMPMSPVLLGLRCFIYYARDRLNLSQTLSGVQAQMTR